MPRVTVGHHLDPNPHDPFVVDLSIKTAASYTLEIVLAL